MRQLREYIARVKQMTPLELLQKSTHLGQKKSKNFLSKAYFLNKPSFTQISIEWEAPRIMVPQVSWIEAHWLLWEKVLNNILDHKFDLLGSGWISLNAQGSHKTEKLKVNRANQSISQNISKKIDSNYRLINWHQDFKSGFQWSPTTWWSDIEYGHIPGVDIKVPWELSRMQHLSWLAFGYVKTKETKYVAEFQNEVLDFISSNPPRFGVNWKCPMDVAIRASNWIASFDMFRSSEVDFPQDFSDTLAKSLFDHGLFIFENLEKLGKERSNHYLANIVGLTFISESLKENKQIASWRKFSRQELLKEADYQFHDVGTNFEGSTAYHRLSSELLNYGLLYLSLADGNFDFISKHPHLIEKIVGSSLFSQAITKPDGNFLQVGDNDNGRLFKFSPHWSSLDLAENYLDISHLCNFKNAFLNEVVVDIESSLINESMKKGSLSPQWSMDLFEEKILTQVQSHFSNPSPVSLEEFSDKKTYTFQIPRGAIDQLESFYFSEFGLVIYKSHSFFLSIRCGPIGQNGQGAHDHNDQLSVELFIDGKTLIADPGTGTYSSDKATRIRYRSNKNHFTPQPEGKEMADIHSALFFLGRARPGKLLSFNENFCTAVFDGFGPLVLRDIRIESQLLTITDYAFEGLKLWDLKEFQPLEYSRGYGFPRN